MTRLQYAPPNSFVDANFWHALSAQKIDQDKLSERPRPILGYYDGSSAGRIEVSATAFTLNEPPRGCSLAPGTIKNMNTIEDFRKLDKKVFLDEFGQSLLDSIRDGSIYDHPGNLASFAVLSFSDLKKYKFYYWFAFPTLTPLAWDLDPEYPQTETPQNVESLWQGILRWASIEGNEHCGFFSAKSTGSGDACEWVIGPLSRCSDDSGDDQFLGFVDPSNGGSNAGWPIPNLLALADIDWKVSRVRVLCFRDNLAQIRAFAETGQKIPAKSFIMSFRKTQTDQVYRVTGWERNMQGKLGPKFVDLAPLMDPKR